MQGIQNGLQKMGVPRGILDIAEKACEIHGYQLSIVFASRGLDNKACVAFELH